MRALVTGAAGFIGSHLVDRLLRDGASVTGVDALTPYYSPRLKRRNVERVSGGDYAFVEADLFVVDLAGLGTFDVVFHLAGQPGIRGSWSTGFEAYQRQNVLVTQHLLEESVRAGVPRFVYASSSSIYGQTDGTVREDALPKPFSPYGVTKLAGEHLVSAYHANFGIEGAVLRYFTVFGPRQRPDMAFARLLATRLGADPVRVFGDGEQSRDFTYVEDAVDATVRAASGPVGVYNVAGGAQATVNEVLEVIATVTGDAPKTNTAPAVPGDVRHTSGGTDAARERLGWTPRVSLVDGLRNQWEWLQSLSPDDLEHYAGRD